VKYIFLKQDGIKDCGISCLLMIIRMYKGGCSKEYLRELTYTTKEGTTAYDLVKAGEKFNFTSFGLRGSIKDVKKEYYPLIAHVIKENKYQHFIVIYNILLDKKQLVVGDPSSSGIRKISIKEFEDISTNKFLIFIPKGKIFNIKTNDKFYKTITNFFKNNIICLISICLLSLLFTILTVISTFYLQILMNKVFIQTSSKLSWTLPSVFILIVFLKVTLHYTRTNILSKLIHKFDFHLNKDIYNHLFLLPDSYYENRTTGEVLSRITDLENIKNTIANTLLDGIISILLSVVSLIILLKINYKLTLFLGVLVILEITLCFFFKDKIRHSIATLKEETAKLYSYLTDTIKEMCAIRHLDCRQFFENKFKTCYSNYLKTYKKYLKYLNLEDFLKNLLVGIFNILIITIGYKYVISNELELSLFIVFLFLHPYFLDPFNKLFDLCINTEDTKEALNRVYEFYQVEEKYPKITLNQDFEFSKLSLKDLKYSYTRDNYVLNNLNLQIEKGEKLLIYGQSGSGKTTLIKIIAGFLKDYSGNVLINDNNYLETIDILRKKVTYIRQGDSLLNMSLRDNILLGRDISEQKFLEVCRLLKIDNFSNKNILNYDMQVEENGENLSAGERQRVLLARGILKEGDIYIFDESLSNLDIKLEREILENIIKYLDGKTIIVVSHRFYNEDLFTRKIELKEGVVYG